MRTFWGFLSLASGAVGAYLIFLISRNQLSGSGMTHAMWGVGVFVASLFAYGISAHSDEAKKIDRERRQSDLQFVAEQERIVQAKRNREREERQRAEDAQRATAARQQDLARQQAATQAECARRHSAQREAERIAQLLAGSGNGKTTTTVTTVVNGVEYKITRTTEPDTAPPAPPAPVRTYSDERW